MILHLNHAFTHTVKARAWALLAAATALAPELAPHDLADWIKAQIPAVPSWASWGAASLIVVYRLWRASIVIASIPVPEDGK